MRGDQRGRGDAEADRHLLHVLAMVLAALVCAVADVGVDQRVHAGVLQRREEAEAEGLQRR